MLIRIAACLCLFIGSQSGRVGLAAETAQETGAIEIGEKAINFELPIVGKDDFIDLQNEYQQGIVVVVVLRGYPGYQCPLCTSQVSALINRARTLKDKVHKVVLVYPGESDELKRHAKKFLGARRIPEPIVLVADPGMKMVQSWGVRWNAPRETAYPATFIVKSNGRVAWKKVSQSHAGRSSVEEIVRQLKKL
ncbi:redoxin domain-containing protein [Planctomycetes bacterium K23_9]|uniref:AhpC/TSA family protein n=1 Tax=Stieleria marina TaxID=1930275 RepID=A0A517NLT0_9BACT|nr:AhpC/TSA family protein [Planctomycetes bacterium K23_9]